MRRIYVNDKPYRIPDGIAVYMAEGAELIAQLRAEVDEARAAARRYLEAGVDAVADLHDAELRIEQLEHDLADLRENAADDAAEFRSIMAETGPDDEQHCTCVPLLRKEVKRLQGIIQDVENERRLTTYIDASTKIKAYLAGDDLVQPCGHPLGCVTNEPHSTTQFCQWCADKAEIRRLYSLLRQWKDESESENESEA